MAKPPFQVDGPPFPTNLPFYQTEALAWLTNDKEGLAYRVDEISTENVKKLYTAGAVRVDVVVRVNGSENLNASELEVTFPPTRIENLLDVIRSLRPTNWEQGEIEEGEDPYADDGSFAGKPVTLSWD